jgi:hypothetical protein
MSSTHHPVAFSESSEDSSHRNIADSPACPKRSAVYRVQPNPSEPVKKSPLPRAHWSDVFVDVPG